MSLSSHGGATVVISHGVLDIKCSLIIYNKSASVKGVRTNDDDSNDDDDDKLLSFYRTYGKMMIPYFNIIIYLSYLEY